ncbi:MAG: glucosaminidase domain-containing protein [Bacteroidales bacterium]|nr:glucosaminidase domain-containing protein [Bacteroidales bacterium]
MDKITTFINTYLPMAAGIEKKYGMPALAVLAQSALETGWGINKPGNMMFGIKAGSSWSGKTQKLLTTEILSAEAVKKLKSYHSITRLDSGKYNVRLYQDFRAYDSPRDSFEDYARLISGNQRYQAALQQKDPYAYASAIAKAGYATATNYYDAIKSIIDTIKKKAVLKRESRLQPEPA